MRDYMLYLLARLALLIVVVALAIVFFGYNLIAIIAAIVISALVSYLALSGLRTRATASLIEWRAQRKARKPEKEKRPRRGSDEDIEDQQITAQADD